MASAQPNTLFANHFPITEPDIDHNIAILGASGLIPARTYRLIAAIHRCKIKALGRTLRRGKPIAEVFPHLRHMDLARL